MVDLPTMPKSRFLDVDREGTTITFSFERCFAESLGLGLRREEARRAARMVLKFLGPARMPPGACVLILDGGDPAGDAIATILNEIDRRLERIAVRPLSARLVEHTLGITARERSRWTKDGRLARSGTDLIRRGQRIALSTYAVSEIARLTNEPKIIRAWRKGDGEYRGLGREA